MKKGEQSYKTLIPKRLHQEVENLLSYLEFFPFEHPTYCHHCCAPKIYFTGLFSRPHSQQVPQYQCATCKRNFNQLTNTIFSRTLYLDKWVTVGKLHLTGLSSPQIAHITGMTRHTALSHCKAINHLMQEKYPKLYQWWHTHYERKDLTFSDSVQQQATFFLQWLNERFTKKDYLCPKCHQAMVWRNKGSYHRPLFICHRCKIYQSAFEGTRLKDLTQMESWIPFTEKLIEGYTCQDIGELTQVKTSTAFRWKHIFLAQMQDLGLNELVQWIEWQRHRRCVQVLKINRWLNNFDKSINYSTDASINR